MAPVPETMSVRRQTVRDLVEEAKKRIVLLLICVFGLSYLMSLTSSSVWVNLPSAATLIILCRYISFDLDARRRITSFKKPSPINQSSRKRPVELQKFPLEDPNWKTKVNSPLVEAAIEQFTRHLVSEWITDLWYSRVTPDRDGPEELVRIMNGVLGEISGRARDVNLINLLTRDIINLICNHLELYRLSQAKFGKQELEKLPISLRDIQLKMVLAADNKLHPALFSLKAEHKVLQHLMDGLISFTFKPEDLNCSFFRYIVRELLACTVIRPVLNLANPRFINEKIESFVLSLADKSDKGVTPSAEETSPSKLNVPPRPASDQFSGILDRSTVGVELVQFRHEHTRAASDEKTIKDTNGTLLLKDPTLQTTDAKRNGKSNSGGEWAHTMDMISRRKTQALAPEHFENMWTKGRNYRKKEGRNQVVKEAVHNKILGITDTSQHPVVPSDYMIQEKAANNNTSQGTIASFHNGDRLVAKSVPVHSNHNGSTHHPITSYQEHLKQQEVELDSESSYPSEDDENNNVTGLDSPGTRVWDSKNKNVAISHIRHPLETNEFQLTKKSGKGDIRHPRALRTSSGRKRHRSSSQKVPIWQEVERTSFLLGEGHDILNASEKDLKADDLSDDQEIEIWGRIHSGTTASSSMSSISASESGNSSFISPQNSVLADSFLKLRCEVLGANIVKSGPGTFAVYSISVTDVNNNSWSIKRRFRHFEELHRHLKEFPEYNLSLPPKHFLSSGLDVPVVRERCKLLDRYLKRLLQFPSISGSIEVWDFLSVDSQTYMFSDSLSIIQTLSVDLEDKQYEKNSKIAGPTEDVKENLLPRGENISSSSKDYLIQKNKNGSDSDNLRFRKRNMEQNMESNATKEYTNLYEDNSGSDSEMRLQKSFLASSKSNNPKKGGLSGPAALLEADQIPETAGDLKILNEWVPPNLSVPVLNLVDVVFQLQDGGWIRRQAFWVAKQLLQLGMGDAFDDWLIEKIQFLRKGSVVASGIKRIEQILWPDGIFITKHPSRKPPTPVSSPSSQKNNMKENISTTEQQLEARRANFVHELIIDRAPAALVSLVGRKEYERCAQDIYFFLQSPLFLKQLAFEILELLLLSAFPELDNVVGQCHEEKEQFGEVEGSNR